MTIASPRFVRTALFPVASLSTHLLPATKAMPKELLPIVDKPLIQYAVEEAVAAGIEHIVLITHRTKRAIEDHFDAAHELERLLELQGKHALLYELRTCVPMRFSLSCVRHNEPPGLGHALLCARHLVADEPFAVLLPDELIQAPRPVLAQMVQHYQRVGGSMVAIEQLRHERTTPCAALDADPVAEGVERVVGFADNPGTAPAAAWSDVAGRYLLSPAIFDALAQASPRNGQELHIIDGLQRLLACEPVFAYRFEGRRFECGSKLGFLEATVNLALDHPEVGEAFASMLGRLGRARANHPDGAGASRRARATPAVPTPAVPN